MLKRILVTLLLINVFILTFGDAKAQSLISPHYEIDAMGFFSADTSSDFAPPAIISGPTVSSLTATSAIIEWTTDVVSSSIVSYGTSDSYGYESGQSEDKVLAHSVKVIGLSPNKNYHYIVKKLFGHL